MVSRTIKIVSAAVLALAVAGSGFIAVSGKDLFHVATHSVSRSLCAAAFVSQVDPDRMFKDEQLPNMRSIGWAVHYQVDREKREVRTTVLGAFAARAVYREGMGCVLVHDGDPVPELAGFKDAPIPGAFPESGVVEPADPALRQALDLAFAEPDPATRRLTKAVVVLHDGKLIAERYAPGYGPETPIWGHSLSKSITSALIGILVQQGKLRLDQPAPIAAWAAPGDPRHAITIDQLLRMDSGLPFDETDGPVNPMTRMFFLEGDMAGYAVKMPLAHPPGTVWAYSNLGYVLLSRIAMNTAGSDGAVAAERFVRSELFAPLGMRNAVIETDAVGTPVGSSHVYASARDFARFGQLYLDDGVVNGRRILPEGWVDYSHSQTLKTGYGAGFWTNRVSDSKVPVWDAPWGIPQLPKDMFYARGALGQYIIIVPSERLVVVRLGISLDYGTAIGDVAAQIIAALHHPSAPS
ncbi:serine hydrolase domain-containing protein [Dyella tabacisoli]|uniref:Class C beta-lactamase-related serine hydrolase n=1 Tax=Dyella tabacisoli TaxID=2282381 RepID=A0A369UI91_9GAMM|nr:serine hydrolase [Dyella tabacisoli]RDD79825.1 class C beta-lactamase-related serine hydrolase [Dyella tabacisoli]